VTDEPYRTAFNRPAHHLQSQERRRVKIVDSHGSKAIKLEIDEKLKEFSSEIGPLF